MQNKIVALFLVLGTISPALFAKNLELRPLLKDRFEHSCEVRQQYDFHDDNTDLVTPLKAYTQNTKYIENQAYDLSTYFLKNVTYANIPIVKMAFGFGRPAEQFNEYLYFDLKTPSAKKAFKSLKLGLNKANKQLSVEYKNNLAIVQCYWIRQY